MVTRTGRNHGPRRRRLQRRQKCRVVRSGTEITQRISRSTTIAAMPGSGKTVRDARFPRARGCTTATRAGYTYRWLRRDSPGTTPCG